MAKMKLERLAIKNLMLDPANVRKHPERNLSAIKASLLRFGQQKPILIDAKGIVVAGNGTVAAAKALGWTHVDTMRTSLSGAEATAYAIADNRSAELAEWDLASLQQQIGSLPDDLREAAGFLDGDIEAMLESAGSELIEPQEPKAKTVPEGGTFQVCVILANESEQQKFYERITAEGLKCRVLTL